MPWAPRSAAISRPINLWVVLSDPQQTGDAILLVSLTTLREGCVDDVCILDVPDFPGYLTHSTTVAYSRAQAGNAAAFTKSVSNGNFSIVSPIPLATLTKIIVGARTSEELSEANKKLLPP